jgi:hypothetical protein
MFFDKYGHKTESLIIHPQGLAQAEIYARALIVSSPAGRPTEHFSYGILPRLGVQPGNFCMRNLPTMPQSTVPYRVCVEPPALETLVSGPPPLAQPGYRLPIPVAPGARPAVF